MDNKLFSLNNDRRFRPWDTDDGKIASGTNGGGGGMGPNDPVTHAELRATEERFDGQFGLLAARLNDIEKAVNRAPEITNTAIVQSQTQLESKIASSQIQLEGKIALAQSQTETKIAQSRNAQTLWTIGTLLVLAPILISVTGWMIVNLK